MKRMLSFVLALWMLLTMAGCAMGSGEGDWVIRPSIFLSDRHYIDPYMPVNELPEGYEYAGELTAEEANDTGLEGCKYYSSDSDPDNFYVYQECGTPISSDTVEPPDGNGPMCNGPMRSGGLRTEARSKKHKTLEQAPITRMGACFHVQTIVFDVFTGGPAGQTYSSYRPPRRAG